MGGSGSPDAPRTLRLASDERGLSYDSGDEVSDVSRKRTPLDLTSEEIGRWGTLVCPGGGYIVWGASVVVVEVNEKGNRKYTPPDAKVIYVCRGRGTGPNRLRYVS